MKAFALLLLLLPILAAEDKPITLPANFCSDFPAANSACKSFKELVDHKDSEILDILRHKCRVGSGQGGATYVCFKDREDKFLAVAYNEPEHWEKASLGSLKGVSSLCLDEYENGIPGGKQQFSWLEWQRFVDSPPSEGMTPLTGKLYEGEHVALGETVATVDPTEITVSRSFHNKSGSRTDYRLAIRRSTKRWVETYQTDKNTYTETGHCTAFDGNSNGNSH